MADQDLDHLDRANTVKIVGSETDGTETNPVGSSSNKELWIRDTHDNGGLDAILSLTTTPIEGMVGIIPKTERKTIVMQGLSNGIKWGFSNTSQSFDLFKNQVATITIGENTEIWLKMSVGTGQVAFGELA